MPSVVKVCIPDHSPEEFGVYDTMTFDNILAQVVKNPSEWKLVDENGRTIVLSQRVAGSKDVECLEVYLAPARRL